MAIYDNNGTSNFEIGKIYDNNGTTSTQIAKVYDNNGTTNSLIYTADITLTNLVGSADVTKTITWSDGGAKGENNLLISSFVGVAGHRYFIRAKVGGYAYVYSGSTLNYDAVVHCSSTPIVAMHTTAQFNTTENTNSIIYTAGAAQPYYIYLDYYRNNSSQGSVKGTAVMIVDITELEAAKGKTYTVETFLSEIGVFYGSKTVEI